jgi:hypothetical protein
VSTVREAADTDAAAPGRSTGRTITAIVLAIIGIIAVIAAILYFTEAAHSLPSILGTLKHPPNSVTRANSHRSLRGAVAIIVGVILLAGAGFAYAWKGKDKN